mmetsp:Transcript_27845/g.88530  ORF Transcript_27845/g.88530 Transcript_27845/m.88530 type:complete len:108 (-) Transcript_27845:784-1107(-)
MTRPSLYKVVATDRWEAFFVDGLTVCRTPCAVAPTSNALHTALLQLARSDFIWNKLTPTVWILEARALAQLHTATAERTTVAEERPPPDTNSDDDDGVDEEIFDLFG